MSSFGIPDSTSSIATPGEVPSYWIQILSPINSMWIGDPWTKQKGESGKAFTAFRIYRGMGGARSVSKVARTLSKSRGTLTCMSRNWFWRHRVDAFDRHMVRKREETGALLNSLQKREAQRLIEEWSALHGKSH